MDMLPCAHRESVLSSDNLSLRALDVHRRSCSIHVIDIVNSLSTIYHLFYKQIRMIYLYLSPEPEGSWYIQFKLRASCTCTHAFSISPFAVGVDRFSKNTSIYIFSRWPHWPRPKTWAPDPRFMISPIINTRFMHSG